MKQPVPFGKYTLLERISVGGMAEVFRAKTFGVEGFERLVAVKRILPNIAEDKEFIRMFVDEAKLAVQLNHANIAQITDLGVVDGSYYIAIEHVHGRDLRSAFDRMRAGNDAMPVSHACYAVMKVCEGLDYAHNKRDSSGSELGLVHRDVSPQNVLISFEGEVKLIDFGIAKAVGSTINTQSGVLKGKIGYMSPEQVRGLPVDRRADVFSCGIVLYEMLTGERLFVGESDFSTLEKVRNVEIPLPTTYNVKIPEELERIVLRALARDVGPRYQHAIDLHDDLQAFVYTAGEFCSRKDMAAWMKRTFAREIEEETAKLEAFRQMQATPSGPAGREARAASPSSSGSPPIAAPPLGRAAIPLPLPLEEGRRTKAMGSPGSKPPPPPGRTQQIVVLDEPSSASSSAKLLTLTPSGALPALPASPPRPGHRQRRRARRRALPRARRRGRQRGQRPRRRQRQQLG
jgi:serine/threonine protein kinase